MNNEFHPSSDDGINATGPQDAPTHEQPIAPSRSTTAPQVPPPPQNAESTACKPEQTPGWKIALEAVGAAVGITLGIIYLLQLGVMRGQLKQMEGSSSQTDKMICLYGNQLIEIRQQGRDTHALARTTRDALVQVQRALMSIEGPRVLRDMKDGTINNFYIGFAWKNGGTTSTVNLITHHNWAFTSTMMPKGFDLTDKWRAGEPHIATPSFAGPQGEIGMEADEISPAIIGAVQSHNISLVFWGWARYRDVFQGTPTHVSRYCVQLIGFHGNALSTNPSEVVVPVYQNCPTHNCHDEECDGEPKPVGTILAVEEPPMEPLKPCDVMK